MVRLEKSMAKENWRKDTKNWEETGLVKTKSSWPVLTMVIKLVKLISKKCGLMDSISKSINIVNSSIRENANSNFFTLYPNPTKDFFVIKSNKIIYKDDIEITIFDNMGREIYHNEAYKVEERIFTKEFLKGNYFVIIKSKSTIYHTRISVI